MKNAQLIQSAQYSNLVNDIYLKLKFSPRRNHLDVYWLKNSAKILNDSINKLLKIDIWTSNEVKLLSELQDLVNPQNKRDVIFKITFNQMNKILKISVDALIDRDELTKDDVYQSGNYKDYKLALRLLDANARLLKMIKSKWEKKLDPRDLKTINIICGSLMESYLYLSNEIKDEMYLTESLKEIKSVWREYRPLEKLQVA